MPDGVNAGNVSGFSVFGKVHFIEVEYVLEGGFYGFDAFIVEQRHNGFRHSARYLESPVFRPQFVQDDFRKVLYLLQ